MGAGALTAAPLARRQVATPAVPWTGMVVGVAALRLAVAPVAAWLGMPETDKAIGWEVYLGLVIVFGLAGAALLALGHRDPRAVSLGVFFLLVGVPFSDRFWTAFAGHFPSTGAAVHAVKSIRVDAFLPYFFWLFVRDFPRVRRVEARALRRTLRGVLAVCSLIFVANLALGFGLTGPAGELMEEWLSRGDSNSAFWTVSFLLIAPALVYAHRRARRASADERRRVRILVAGLTAGMAPIVVIVAAIAFIPGVNDFLRDGDGRRIRDAGFIVYPALYSIPFVTAYAVLVHRALDLQLIVRRALQYASARHAFTLISATPFAAVLVTAYLNRQRSVAELLSGESGLALAGAAAGGVALVLLRPRMIGALDRVFFREQHDARRVLGRLAGETRLARTTEELAATLEQGIDGALHLRSVRLLVLRPASAALAAADAAVAPLALHTRLARLLEARAEPLEVDWTRPARWLASLPADEQGWLLDADARLLVPITTSDLSLLGVLCLGEKRSELPFSEEDTLLLATIALSAAGWLEHRIGAVSSPAPGSAESAGEPARECPACAAVGPPAADTCAGCGAGTAAAPVPLVLNAKYRMLERVGSGAMGVVYRALDLALDREVAVKTLPRVSPRAVLQLREEARAMAAVWHPGLAQIYAAESWRGVPMLVVEYLPGRTLAERIGAGPVDAAEAVELAATLTPALARLHGAGILHRDIKPTNIGFAGDGTPKLLDFGLARVLAAADDDAPGAGTPLYLSPEAARGEDADVGLDLWALAMVLFEAVAGRHPYAGGTPHRALLRVYDGVVPDLREVAPEAPAPLADFLRDALHPDPRRRPATADELGRRLHALRSAL